LASILKQKIHLTVIYIYIYIYIYVYIYICISMYMQLRILRRGFCGGTLGDLGQRLDFVAICSVFVTLAPLAKARGLMKLLQAPGDTQGIKFDPFGAQA